MSDATLNGESVLRAQLTVPLLGAWVLDVETDTDRAITGRVPFVAGGMTWSGTVVRGGVEAGTWRGRLVGGANGLGRPLPARAYRSVTARSIAEGIVSEAGEQLADMALDPILTSWTRPGLTGAELLKLLVTYLGLGWRMQPDGAVWIGSESWPLDAGAWEELGRDPQRGTVTLAIDAPTLLPGATLAAETDRVAGVVYTFDATLRAQVWLA
jgi:hypothetical protein